MDKTIEIILVAAVILITASIVMVIFSSESDNFSEWISTNSEDSQCELAQQTCNTDSFQENNCGEKGFNPPSIQECRNSAAGSITGQNGFNQSSNISAADRCVDIEGQTVQGSATTSPSYGDVNKEDNPDRIYEDDGSLVIDGEERGRGPSFGWEPLPEEDKTIELTIEFVRKGDTHITFDSYSYFEQAETCTTSTVADIWIRDSFEIADESFSKENENLNMQVTEGEEIDIRLSKEGAIFDWEVRVGDKAKHVSHRLQDRNLLNDFSRVNFQLTDSAEVKIHDVTVTDDGEDDLHCGMLDQKSCNSADQCEADYDADYNYLGCVAQGEGGAPE